ncbi:hypothetical protein QU38_01525, partial [Staphylococcus aureus]
AAGGECGGDLGDDLVERPVPGRDHRDHADGLVHDQAVADLLLEPEFPERLGGGHQVAEAGADLRGPGQADRGTHLQADRLGHVAGAILVLGEDRFDQRHPLVDAGAREALKGLARRGDGMVDIGFGAQRDLGDGFLGRRVDHFVP